MDEARAALDGGMPLTEAPPPRPMGRPTDYNEAIARTLIERIATTNDSVRDICLEDAFPHRTTIDRWREAHPEFDRAYRMAQWGRIEDMAFECIKIADDGDRDMRTELNDNGVVTVVDKEHLIRTEIRLRERHWLVAKLSPKRFGNEPEEHFAVPQIAAVAPAENEPAPGSDRITAEDNPSLQTIANWKHDVEKFGGLK